MLYMFLTVSCYILQAHEFCHPLFDQLCFLEGFSGRNNSRILELFTVFNYRFLLVSISPRVISSAWHYAVQYVCYRCPEQYKSNIWHFFSLSMPRWYWLPDLSLLTIYCLEVESCLEERATSDFVLNYSTVSNYTGLSMAGDYTTLDVLAGP